MHFVNAKSILSAKNGMNLYRGCSHGCIYCDSRSTCYHMEHDFEDIEIKANAIELLEHALKRKRAKCMLGTGSMTDPYIPLESKIGNVRKALALADQYGFGFTLITKSDRVLRDLDLLKSINDKTKCVVQMTLTTCDENLCRKIEPNVSTTKERVEALKRLHEAGIPTVVWLCPVLPFINDTEENIRGILKYCTEAKVYGVICFGMGMTLREGNREYFYSRLDRLFPHMKEKYMRIYGTQYQISSPKNNELMKLFHQICEDNGIVHDNSKLFEYLSCFEEKNSPVQLSLFDYEPFSL
ncbi:MAG: radical SAM protein [Lachnospiraceae bacterium]|nr:radical SAM protein [Lachnospiraceae bacterium]